MACNAHGKNVPLTEGQEKRRDGRYYTSRSPFSHPQFRAWAARAGLPGALLLEPFAGAGSLIGMLQHEGLVGDFRAFDIAPAAAFVEPRDCFRDYPKGSGVVVTNPPYMAKNSARRRRLPYPDTEFQDLYLYALDLMLAHSPFVAAIVPAAFGRLELFRDRLTHLIDLPFRNMFEETHHPVCLCLFEPRSEGAVFWSWTVRLGREARLRAAVPTLPEPAEVTFNSPHGLVGLRAVDSNLGPSIEFVRGEEIDPDLVKNSSRSLTRLDVKGVDEANLDAVLMAANKRLQRVRQMTADVALAPFMGVRKDGGFRRRLDFKTAKIILSLALDAVSDKES